MQRILENRVAIITGANQGLGLAIARKYIEAGILGLSICARDDSLLEKAKWDLVRLADSNQRIFAEAIDVSNSGDVASFVSKTTDQFGQIDILVNNAGVYGAMGEIEEVEWEHWVRTIQINLFGSVMMCRAILPYFKSQMHGKIVQLSGGGAANPLPRLSAYAVSKAALVRFIETLAEEVKDYGIDANAIAPGALNTRMLDDVLKAGPEKVGQVFFEKSLLQKQSGGSPPDKAANLAVFLGSSLSNGISGKLISAIWDPWVDLPNHLDELRTTDIYTLRRILPGDRGRSWGDVT
jgi:3-oxoacyl-[acyl-carrier protein] reductase